MKVSICLATYERPMYLDRVLRSILRQKPPFEYEVIVADDGWLISDDNRMICNQFPEVKYLRVDGSPGFRNPSKARNVAYRAARGDIVICQSDDVEHQGDAIEGLVSELQEGKFAIATVWNKSWKGEPVPRPMGKFAGPDVQRPFFFLGALWRKDLYAVGGSDERFIAPAFDDNWFADCLRRGLGLKPRFLDSVVGHHLAHDRPENLPELVGPSQKLYGELVAEAEKTGKWQTEDAPWGIMPKKMHFFWTGPMSWMRYLTVSSFRALHPDWEIVFVEPAGKCGPKNWLTFEDDDSAYSGRDYRDEIAELGVVRQAWEPPPGMELPAAQASDLFQWGALATAGGFYADMDILWLKSLEPLRREIESADAVFCLEESLLAIGFMASQPGSPLFRDVLRLGLEGNCNGRSGYQNYGAKLLYRFANTSSVQNTSSPWPGAAAIGAIRSKYPDLNVTVVPDATVYPFDWQQVERIFERTYPVSDRSYGIHWFGGHPIAQKWNNLLTEDNWQDHQNTFTQCLEKIHGTPVLGH